MKKIGLYLLFLLFFAPALRAQNPSPYVGQGQPMAERQGDRLLLYAELPAERFRLHRQQLLSLTPVLRSIDRTHRIVFAPVAVVGRTRLKAIRRAEALGGGKLEPTPSQIIRYQRRNEEPVRFELEAFYEPWMQNAELILTAQVTGCLGKAVSQTEERMMSPVLPPEPVRVMEQPEPVVVEPPTFYITYAEPPTEAVKERSESYTARVNFSVNSYELRHNYMGNASVLEEVDRIIDDINQDNNLTITELHVTGYASPEGSAAHNLRLSEQRAWAFADYVLRRHDISRRSLRVDWRGEDWDGLRKMMEESYFSDRYRVLTVLNGSPDLFQRKARLGALSSYGTLLREYYPYLRRNEYTIRYIARPFDVEEAKVLIHTKPQHLSLNEMFLVANTYPRDSHQFKEVFDIASRLYPDSDYANLNSAALDIEEGALDTALTRLSGISMPEAWNNMGCIYVRKQDYTKAAEYFRRAAAAGLDAAADNLKALDSWIAVQ